MSLRLSLIVFACLTFFFAPAARAEFVAKVSDRASNGVGIQLHSALDAVPTHGTYPLIVEIINDSGFTHSWTFSAGTRAWGGVGQGEIKQTFEVASGKSERFVMYIDIAGSRSPGSSSTPYVQVNVSGYGVTYPTHSLPNASAAYNSVLTPYLLMSDDLRALYSKLHSEWTGNSPTTTKGVPAKEENYPALSALLTGKSQSLFFLGSQSNLETLPHDWRGYLGVDQLWLTDLDWPRLALPVRDAIRAWVLQGGFLVLVSPAFSDGLLNELSLTRTKGNMRTQLGLGTVMAVEADPDRMSALDVSEVMGLSINDDTPFMAGESAPYSSDWPLVPKQRFLGAVGPIVVVTIIIYAFFVGPVNVFWWARKNRALLYVTTPLISLAATLALSMFIIFRDGTGGTGERHVAALLSPSDKQLVVVQEQVARSGLLFRREFSMPDSSVMRVAQLSESRPSHSYRVDSGDWSREDANYVGDWFRNRSTNAHIIQSISPSRARVELLSASQSAGPKVFSSVSATFNEFYFVDEGGNVWQTQNLSPGKETTLSRGGQDGLQRMFIHERTQSGPAIRELLQRVDKQRNYFFARVDNAESTAVPTLTSIRWTSTSGIFAGPIAKREG